MSAAPDSTRFVLIPVAPDTIRTTDATAPEALASDEAGARHSDITALLRPPATAAGGTLKLDAIAAKIKVLASGSSTGEVLQLGELIFREVYGSQRTPTFRAR